MTRTKRLTAKNPGDLLAMVPYVLGFHPEDSVVILTLGDAGHRFHARVDIPTDPVDIAGLVDYLAGVVRANRLTAAALVVYCDDEKVAEAVAEPLAARFEAEGVAVPMALRADGQRWFTLAGCSIPGPPAGTPYDVGSHPITAQGVVEGKVTLRSRAELRDSLVGADPEEVEAVGRAADEALMRFAAAARHPLGPPAPEAARAHQVQEGHWVDHRVRRFLRDRSRLDAADVGRLLVALASIEVRDVAWSQMRQANAAVHVDLWRDVVRRAPLDLLAPPAALLGFAAWLAGDGALAWCAVDRCQEADPDYRLAGLLTHALAGAVPPSTWEPLDRGVLTLFAG
jgi:hypothetical protein